MLGGVEGFRQDLRSPFFISKQPLSFPHAKQTFDYQGKNLTAGTVKLTVNCKLLQQTAQTIKFSDWFFFIGFSSRFMHGRSGFMWWVKLSKEV